MIVFIGHILSIQGDLSELSDTFSVANQGIRRFGTLHVPTVQFVERRGDHAGRRVQRILCR